MDREEKLKLILGERYEEGREIGNIVLDFVEKPKRKDNHSEYRESVYDALNSAFVELYGTGIESYATKTRKRSIVDTRSIAMYILRNETRLSTTEIGEMFSKHHATVIVNCDKIEFLVDMDKTIRKEYQSLKKQFKKNL